MSMQLTEESAGLHGKEAKAMDQALEVLFGIDQSMLDQYANEDRVWIDAIPREEKKEELE